MKKKISTLLMLLTLCVSTSFITACGDDDEDNKSLITTNGDNGSNSSSEYSRLIVGTWTVTMDDPGWKCYVTFNANGTFTSKEYYDEYANNTFSEYEGTYTGSYIISKNSITISPSKDESVINFKGSIRSLTANSGVFADSDGWCIYLAK